MSLFYMAISHNSEFGENRVCLTPKWEFQGLSTSISYFNARSLVFILLILVSGHVLASFVVNFLT